MLIKLDENLGERGRGMMSAAGHDVATVADEGLAGADDPRVIEVCAAEHRCLVTLDLDFSNPFVFPPEQFAGIAVLRLPRRVTPDNLYATLGTLISALAQQPIEGKLWIVEGHRIREYLSESEPSEPELGEGTVGDD
jgi:predicted nuclease of predicted toxin-antitoxin system